MDTALSSDDLEALQIAYAGLRAALLDSNFAINENKSQGPDEAMELFNRWDPAAKQGNACGSTVLAVSYLRPDCDRTGTSGRS
jgi:hypothetical protein